MINVTKKELEERLTEYRLLEQNHEVLMKRREEIIPRLIEIRGTIDSVEELEKGKEDEVFLPMGSGVFIPVKVNKKRKLIVAIGSDLVLENDLKGIKDLMKKRQEILEKGLESIEKDLISTENRMAGLEPKLRELMK